MKTFSIVLLLFIYQSFNACKAQFITLPDSAFANLLHSNEGCVAGNQLDTTCAVFIQSIDCSSSSIHDITGIQYFKGLTSLNCSYDSLTFIPRLPDGLLTLDCSHNQIRTMHSLPIALQYLDCSKNLLTVLPALPENLQQLYCYFNQLSTLPALPAGIQYIDCNSNNIDSLPALPDSLTSLYCDGNHLITFPSLPLQLKFLDCYDNQLTSIPSLPPFLYRLDCGYNQLTEIPSLPDSMYYLICSHNPLLSCFPELKKIHDLLQFDSTNIKCAPDYIHVIASFPPLDSLPLCDSVNPNNCALYNGITEIKALNFSIYPNPASDYLMIDAGTGINGDIEVLDIMGNELMKYRITNSETRIPVSMLAQGIYLVKVSDGLGHMGVQKLIKE